MFDAAAAAVPKGPSPAYRWIVLVVISLAMFGNYYVYDSIAPIADMLQDELGFTDANIGTLNTMYSIAAVLVLLIGGIAIDRYGTVKSTIFFGALCTVAAVINAMTSDFMMMAASRFVLGLGAEPLIVAITTALAKWFKGRELGFAFGINLTIARLGSFAADWSPTWAEKAYESWQMPLVIAAIIGTLCVISPLGYGAMETHANRKWGLGKAGETDKFRFADLFKFSRSFWFVVLLCVTFYSAIFPFRTFSIKFFQHVWDMSRADAGQANSVMIFASMIATPLFGLMVDKFGRRSHMMIVGSFLLMPVYVLLAYKLLPFGVPIAMLGIAFSLVPAVMWPAVAYIVDERRLGSAYSVMTLIQQVGVAGMNWLIGRVNDGSAAGADNPAGYATGMWIFSILGFLALAFAIALLIAERGPHGHGLDKPSPTEA